VIGLAQSSGALGFGGALTAMVLLGLVALAASWRIGAVENHSVSL